MLLILVVIKMAKNVKSQTGKKRSFLKRHRSLSREEVVKRLREMEEIKQQYETDSASLESNIKDFNLQTDPLIDPITGKALCWVRRPTQDELERLVPTELTKYESLAEVPEEIQEKYANVQFKMMAQLIEKPKKDSAWWKKNANMVFQELFQLHLIDIYKKLGLLIENF